MGDASVTTLGMEKHHAHKLLTMEPMTAPTTAATMAEPTMGPTMVATMEPTTEPTMAETTMEVATSQSSLTQPQSSRQSGLILTTTIQSSLDRCTKWISLLTTSRGS